MVSGNDLLNVKADENKRVALWAGNNSHYNASVSRYYYSSYQRICSFLVGKDYKLQDILNEHREKKKTEDYEYKNKGDHDIIIQTALREAFGISYKDARVLNDIEVLKKKRKIADYDNKTITKSDHSDVRRTFDIIEVAINNIIK